MGAQPPPRALERAAFKVADSATLDRQARADLDALEQKLHIPTPGNWAKFCGSKHEGVTPYVGYRRRPSGSTLKVSSLAVPQLAPSSPPVPPQGAPAGPGQPGTPRVGPATGRRVTASGPHASKLPMSLPLTAQVQSSAAPAQH